jgi:hypothetical protein
MKKYIFLIAVICLAQFSYAQQMIRPPAAYYSNLAIADSLSDLKEYKEATRFLNNAFEAFGWRGIPADRFKAARIFALANNDDSAFKNLERLGKQEYINYLKITKDTAFKNLQQNNPSRFDTLIQHIKDNKEKFAPQQNLVLTNYLDSIFYEDQYLRTKWDKASMAYGFNSPEANAFWPEIKLKDSSNRIAISNFINKYGWLGKDEVGYNGNATLFLVIQHSDTATQEKFLPVLKKAVKEKKAQPGDLALLIDRLSVIKYGYQIYGSQVHEDPTTKKPVFFPIKDEKEVDNRRKNMDMEPLADYAKRFGIIYKPKD